MQRVKYDSSPKWNQQFEYTLEEAPVDQKIRIGVMSKRKSLLVFPKNVRISHNCLMVNELNIINPKS